LNRSLPRLRAVVADSGARAVLTLSSIVGIAEAIRAQAPELGSLEWIATDELPFDPASAALRRPRDAQVVAFLQYTSGSTGDPKGIMLTHANLLANSAAIHSVFGHSPASQGVIWLPPYHDMGLIGGILQFLYGGFPVTLMSPMAFLGKPVRWLKAISRYHATTSGAPNFAFELCVRKVTEEDKVGLDLRSWNVAFCGAEPVRPSTLRRFASAFAECGFQRRAFLPCYGLAESTLMVTGIRRPSPLAAAAPEEPRHVGCGGVIAGHEVVIVDPETGAPRQPGVVGEIWVRGPSVAAGIWNRGEATRASFQARTPAGDGPFLRTGDLGYFAAGELCVTGRIKDLIISRGRKFHPHDIEETVYAAHPLVRSGCAAAFSALLRDEEQLCVVAELVTEPDPHEGQKVIQAIRRSVSTEHELQVRRIALLRQRTIPKTSSGKIQRYLCRDGLLGGTLDVLVDDPLFQAFESRGENP
jgi:acyl-CoA synthetase (AMP-forming)/AMP-acid ligase II